MYFSRSIWTQAFSEIRQDESLLRLAEAAAEKELYTVTKKRHVLPEGGCVNDYVSIAPYWWPDPEKADGLPWIRRDGEINPIYYEYDVEPMFHFVNDVDLLLLLGLSRNDFTLQRRAAEQLKSWFITPETRMNPHVRYGQFVPGRCNGRCFGIVDFYAMSKMLDLVAMMQENSYWTAQDKAALQAWMSDFVDWLQNDSIGKEERATTNNHGTSYDMTLCNMALFAGRKDLAIRQLMEYSIPRIATQFAEDGSMPLELARTNSRGYSCGGLLNFLYLALMAQGCEVDFPLDKIRQGFHWLIEHISRDDWAYQQICPFSQRSLAPVYFIAGILFQVQEYTDIARTLSKYPWDRLFILPRL